MALDGKKKGSKFSFASAINSTVKPQAKPEQKPEPAVGQGNVEEKTVTLEVKPAAEPKETKTPETEVVKPTVAEDVNTTEVANDTTDTLVTEVTTAEEVQEEPTEVVTEEEKPKKVTKTARNKGGRKKVLGDVKRVIISIPQNLIDDVTNAAAVLHNGNVNSYIRSLIVKDIKENKATYDKINELKKLAHS